MPKGVLIRFMQAGQLLDRAGWEYSGTGFLRCIRCKQANRLRDLTLTLSYIDSKSPRQLVEEVGTQEKDYIWP